ncbi:MAG: hypothetical protein B6I26_01885 [Desulfobacteraceae bacterium 4572_130]|nr:MAG: hypothetical protein B6I26_01885 [Desulfobacteraceae bacterium 4572_130]
MYNYKLKSHPDRLLKDHILGVQNKALLLFDKLKFDFSNFKREELRRVVSITSLFHDFGKATSFFQEYLLNPDVSSTEEDRKKRRHGLISALMAFGILQEKIPNNLILQLIGLIIVRQHHGNLNDYKILLTFKDKDLSNVLLQIENLNFNEFQNIVSNSDYTSFINKDFINKDFIKQSVKCFQPRTPLKIKRLSRNFTIEHYFVVNLLYSILLQADKTDAILKDDKVPQFELLKSKNVESFKNSFNNNLEKPIDVIRENAFYSAIETINNLKSDNRILSINIPTGSGKTITSLNAALKLCEKFNHDHIIYCLPFTSVIDQNFEVFDKICEIAKLPDSTGVLLKHHHLADISYKIVKEENIIKEYLPNEALHLIEGWESKITVTTFVQLIYSLISYKNSSLRKFNRFSNAVIILDEIQSIPHKYWSLIKTILSKTAKWLNSKIILVTATMPLIFSEENNEIIELIKGKKEMFQKLSRIELDVLNLNKGRMNWDEFCDSAITLAMDNSEKNILFIMNTIRSAKQLFDVLSKNNIVHKVFFLSSHIIPKERLRRIEYIKNKEKGKPILVVSTQLVEAGVDIDLDIVVRDFAPLDSIFQACGRCNRENRNGVKGKVILYSLKDSNNWTTDGIYKDFLKQKTKKVLKNKEIIYESEFYDLAYQYFKEIKVGGSQESSNILLKRIECLKYQEEEGKIELDIIDNDYSDSIFVELDEKAKDYWLKYQNTLEMENGFNKNALLKQVRRKLFEYIINIPKKCLPAEHDTNIYYLRNNRVAEFYDNITGFNIDSQLPLEKSVDFV